MAAIVNTVTDLLESVRIDNVGQFNGLTNAQRVTADLFDDDFGSFIDKTETEIEADLKMYSALTIVNRKIRLQPGEKRSIIKLRAPFRLPSTEINLLSSAKLHKIYSRSSGLTILSC